MAHACEVRRMFRRMTFASARAMEVRGSRHCPASSLSLRPSSPSGRKCHRSSDPSSFLVINMGDSIGPSLERELLATQWRIKYNWPSYTSPTYIPFILPCSVLLFLPSLLQPARLAVSVMALFSLCGLPPLLEAEMSFAARYIKPPSQDRTSSARGDVGNSANSRKLAKALSMRVISALMFLVGQWWYQWR